MSEYVLSEKNSKVFNLIKGIFALMIIMIHVDGNGVNFADGTVTFEHPSWFMIAKRILSDTVPCCAVPGFFTISGILLYRKQFTWKSNIIKKVTSLLIPYFIVNTFWIIFYAIAQNVPMLSGYFSDPNKMVSKWGIIEYLDAYLGFGTSNGVCLLYAPFWFLRDLFVLNLLAIILKKIIDNCPWLVAGILLIMMLCNISTHIFFLGRNSLFFFCLGYYIVKYGIKIFDVSKINFWYLTLLYGISILSELVFSNHLSHFLVICVGLIFWLKMTMILCEAPKKKLTFFEILSHYNFLIFLIHYIPSAIIVKMLFVIMPKKEIFFIIEYFLSILCVLAFSVSISWIIERFIPRLFHLLMGKRR